MVQLFVGIAAVLGALIIMAVFWKIGSSSLPRDDDYKHVSEAGYAVRRKYFWALLSVSVVLFIIGIIAFPYPKIMEAKIKGETFVVKINSKQFQWDLSATQIPMGPVRFDVTSQDVNHGFGIYDEKGMIVAQSQAMPDYVNKLYVNFTNPGKYKIWCLEYCGVAHHIMTTEFEVK